MRRRRRLQSYWIVLAAVAERHGLWQAVELVYAGALKSRPDDVVLLNNWASAKMKLPQFSASADEVLAICHKLHAQHPDELVSMDTLAECLQRCEKLDESAAVLLKLEQRYRAIGQKDKALDALRSCREIQDQVGNWNLPMSRSELDQDIATLEA